MDFSKRENELLKAQSSLASVFANINEKMNLVHKVSKLDESIKDLKDQWLQLQKNGETLPQNIVNLLAQVEGILQETISLDENNNSIILEYYKNQNIPSKPINIKKNNELRAKNAYGNF